MCSLGGVWVVDAALLEETQALEVALDAVNALIDAAAFVKDGVGVSGGRLAVHRLHFVVVTAGVGWEGRLTIAASSQCCGCYRSHQLHLLAVVRHIRHRIRLAEDDRSLLVVVDRRSRLVVAVVGEEPVERRGCRTAGRDCPRPDHIFLLLMMHMGLFGRILRHRRSLHSPSTAMLAEEDQVDSGRAGQAS